MIHYISECIWTTNEETGAQGMEADGGEMMSATLTEAHVHQNKENGYLLYYAEEKYKRAFVLEE